MIMEFKENIAIFRKHQNYFWRTVLVCVLIGAFGQFLQREHVTSNLTLNVTRLGKDITSDYQYHDFYRLQADERFADTVVRWLGSPRIVSDIYDDTTERERGVFKAERLSSQMIQVTYDASDEDSAKKIAQSLVSRINKETSDLNKDQQESSWFAIVGGEPVTKDGKIGMLSVLTIALVLGMFIGFWVVLIKHYFSKAKNN